MLRKTTRNFLAIVFVCAASAIFCGAATAQQVLKQEPPFGQLKLGQRVLVDDGRCPKGQIMEVTGGDHLKAGGSKQIERSRRCIPR